MEERKLDDIAMSTAMGMTVIEDMLINGYTWQEQAEREAVLIAKYVAIYELDDWSVKNLRAYTNAFNDLDAEAVDVSGDQIYVLEGYDVVEAIARRIGHHAGKIALSYVGTENDRIRFRNRNKKDRAVEVRYNPMPGMGRLELHDIQALREEAEQVE